MKKIFTKIKETKIWYFLIKVFFIPIFNFLWEFIINCHGKYLYFQWKRKNNEYQNMFGNNTLLIKSDSQIKAISQEINSIFDDDLCKKLEKKIIEQKKKFTGHYTESKELYNISCSDELPLSLRKKIIDFALSDKNISTAMNHLKTFPILSIVNVYYNMAREGAVERGSMLWHKDDFGYRSLDFFIPATIVDDNNGPLYFVKNKNELGVFLKYKNIIKNPKKGERNKINLDDFLKYHSQEEVDCLKGELGSALIIDSFNTYHRGGYCKNKHRVMLRLSYQTPDSLHAQSLEKNISTKLLEEYIAKYKFDKFRKYMLCKKLSLIPRAINLNLLLLKFYQLAHFKK